MTVHMDEQSFLKLQEHAQDIEERLSAFIQHMSSNHMQISLMSLIHAQTRAKNTRTILSGYSEQVGETPVDEPVKQDETNL